MSLGTAAERNVIARPHGAGRTFVQLDDLKAERLAPLAPAVFLTLETSPGNFQAWVVLDGNEDKDFARRLRKGMGAEATASGATHVAGSVNFKDKYAPDFPRVAIHRAYAGRIATAAELDRLGWWRRRKLSRSLHPPPLPARDQAPASADGRATRAASTVRRSTAKKPAPIPAAPISCGA